MKKTTLYYVALGMLLHGVTPCFPEISFDGLQADLMCAQSAHQAVQERLPAAYKPRHHQYALAIEKILTLLSDSASHQQVLEKFPAITKELNHLALSTQRARGPLLPRNVRTMGKAAEAVQKTVSSTFRLRGSGISMSERVFLDRINLLSTLLSYLAQQNTFWGFSANQLFFDTMVDKPSEYMHDHAAGLAITGAVTFGSLALYLAWCYQQGIEPFSFFTQGQSNPLLPAGPKVLPWNRANSCFALATMFCLARFMPRVLAKQQNVLPEHASRALDALNAIFNDNLTEEQKKAAFAAFDTPKMRQELFSQEGANGQRQLGRDGVQEDAQEFFTRLYDAFAYPQGDGPFEFWVDESLQCQNGHSKPNTEIWHEFEIDLQNAGQRSPLVNTMSSVQHKLKTNATEELPAVRPYYSHRLQAMAHEPGVLCDVDGCQNRGAIKSWHFATYPQYLAVHNKLFVATQAGARYKVNNFIFPNPTITLEDRRPGRAIRYHRYKLQGVVLHAGSLGGGHYTAVVRDDQAGVWKFWNDGQQQDEQVALADAHKLRDLLLKLYWQHGFTPYLMFYEKYVL